MSTEQQQQQPDQQPKKRGGVILKDLLNISERRHRNFDTCTLH